MATAGAAGPEADETLVTSSPEEEHKPEADPNAHAGEPCETWGALARVCGAELVGTALLVLLAAGAEPLQAGLVLVLLLQCFGATSGAQLNPIVSLAAWWRRRVPGRRAAGELAAQLAGAALGAAVHPRPAAATLHLTAPALQGLAVEALCGACVVLLNCAQWERGAAHTWPLRMGGAVAALAHFAGPWTGAGMNPARCFGPALVTARWERHWVYWVGPLAGAAGALALHAALRPAPLPLPPPPPPPPQRPRRKPASPPA